MHNNVTRNLVSSTSWGQFSRVRFELDKIYYEALTRRYISYSTHYFSMITIKSSELSNAGVELTSASWTDLCHTMVILTEIVEVR